jgi:hypothetical protein
MMAMKFRSDQVAVILAGLVLTFGAPSISAEAKARHCTSAECACEQALKRNTAEALEGFLKKYQHDADVRNTACAAVSAPDEAAGAEAQKVEYSSPAKPGVSTTESSEPSL